MLNRFDNPRYTHKEHEGLLFELVGIDDAYATFVHLPLFGDKVTKQVGIDDLKARRPTKKEQPKKCTPEMVALHSPENSSFSWKSRRAKVQHLLLQGYQDSLQGQKSLHESLRFVSPPSGLWASKKIPKGKLKLWPCGSVSKVKDSTTNNNGWVVGLEGVSCSITPFKAFTDFVTPTKDKHAHLLVPFFWVKRNKEEGSGNMEVKMMSYNGLKVPTLVNTDQIEASAQLLLEDKVDEVKPSASKKRKAK